MKKNMLTLAAFFIAFAAFAQSSEEARNILDRVHSAFEASNGIRLNFTAYITEANGTTHQAQSGEAMIRGDRFKLAMDGIDVWFDGTTQWVLMHDFDEVNISNPAGNEIATISPLALLGMYRGYILQNPVSETVNGRNAFVINMTPATTANNDFQEISVAIDRETTTILQVNLTMGNGMKTRINITNYNANHNFSDSDFVFNVSEHPNVEIVDLR
jgi:outer membrane lipoprotein-sorting protein